MILFVLKEIIKNQLILNPFVKIIARKVNSKTGLNGNPKLVDEVYNMYTSQYAVKDKSILELGPGHTYQVIAKAIENGAKSGTIIDIDKYIDDKTIKDSGIDYYIYDGKTLPFKDETFDLIWSHTVYEHLRFPETTVNEVFRVLKKDGIIIHHIDLRDHLILDEENPNTFNMLQFSEETWWKMASNRSIYVNRLRASEWLKLHQSVGHKNIDLTIFSRSNIVAKLFEEGKIDYLKRFSKDDASIAQIRLIAQK